MNHHIDDCDLVGTSGVEAAFAAADRRAAADTAARTGFPLLADIAADTASRYERMHGWGLPARLHAMVPAALVLARDGLNFDDLDGELGDRLATADVAYGVLAARELAGDISNAIAEAPLRDDTAGLLLVTDCDPSPLGGAPAAGLPNAKRVRFVVAVTLAGGTALFYADTRGLRVGPFPDPRKGARDLPPWLIAAMTQRVDELRRRLNCAS